MSDKEEQDSCWSWEERVVRSKQELYDKSSICAQWRTRQSKLVAKGRNDRNLEGHESFYSRTHNH